MTKEEKLELAKKLDTQIDGVEAYIRQLEEAEADDNAWFLRSAIGSLSTLRKEIECYKYVELTQAWRN